MEPHRVLQETAYPSLAYGLFGLGRFLQQIPDSYKRVIFMSICGSIWLSLDTPEWIPGLLFAPFFPLRTLIARTGF